MKIHPRWEEYNGFIEWEARSPNTDRIKRMIEYYCHQKLASSPAEASLRSLRLPLITRKSPYMELYPISGRIPQSSLVTSKLSENASNTNANIVASQELWRVSNQNPWALEYFAKSSTWKEFVLPGHGVYNVDQISIGSLVAPESLSKGRRGWILHLTSTSAIRKVADRAYLQAKMRDAFHVPGVERFSFGIARMFEYAANLRSPQLSLLREAVNLDIGKLTSLRKMFQQGQDILTLYLVNGYRIYVNSKLIHDKRNAPILRQFIPRNEVHSYGKAIIAALQACRIDINYDLTVENISAPKWYGFWGPKEDFDERWPLDA